MEVSGEVADLMVKEGLEAAKIATELSAKGARPCGGTAGRYGQAELQGGRQSRH